MASGLDKSGTGPKQYWFDVGRSRKGISRPTLSLILAKGLKRLMPKLRWLKKRMVASPAGRKEPALFLIFRPLKLPS